MLEIGPGRWAHPAGVLWLPGPSTIIIADAHLGYGWAQRRRGELGPVIDDVTPRRIVSLLDELHPRRVVFLGDIVHAPKPAPDERELVSAILRRTAERAELVLVRGNHDRGFERDFAGSLVEHWEAPGLLAVHGDRLPAHSRLRHIVAGHWHPAWKIRDAAGVRHRLPVFASNVEVTILPAFSPFAAGMDLSKGLPEAWRQEDGGRMRIYAATGRTVTLVAEKGF
jgi:uncharacterized protein